MRGRHRTLRAHRCALWIEFCRGSWEFVDSQLDLSAEFFIESTNKKQMREFKRADNVNRLYRLTQLMGLILWKERQIVRVMSRSVHVCEK